MARLVLLGGPTGVGKSTVMALLEKRIPNGALLDADDVWRVSKELSIEGNRNMALSNVIAVMRGYYQAGCETGILSWVFARSALYQPVIDGVGDLVEVVDQIYLTATKEELKHRLCARGDENRFAYSLSRLELINSLPYKKIDTTSLRPEAVADEIVSRW